MTATQSNDTDDRESTDRDDWPGRGDWPRGEPAPDLAGGHAELQAQGPFCEHIGIDVDGNTYWDGRDVRPRVTVTLRLGFLTVPLQLPAALARELRDQLDAAVAHAEGDVRQLETADDEA